MPLPWNPKNCVFTLAAGGKDACWFDRYTMWHLSSVPFLYAVVLYLCYRYGKITTTRGAFFLLVGAVVIHLIDEILNNYTNVSFSHRWDGVDNDSMQNFLGDNFAAIVGLLIVFAVFKYTDPAKGLFVWAGAALLLVCAFVYYTFIPEK